MARAKSEDKRTAILEAATRAFAERGLDAATSAISKRAGIAEGTLFTYFKTKDDLVNVLYREIKKELADAMMASYPRKKSVRVRLKHVWDRYVEWGVEHDERQKVLRRIQVWDGLTKESKKAATAAFFEIISMIVEAEELGVMKDLPRRFGVGAMEALADAVMEMAREDPKRVDIYREAGFEMLWGGIARRS